MLTVLYSYGKPGEEGELWEREIAASSTAEVRFVPFNHRAALDGLYYDHAVQLDRDHRASHPRLLRLYRRLDDALARSGAQCLFVTNDQPYHPDHLLKIPIYRAYHTTDDPGSTYTRTIPFVHAFHHLLHCALPYSAEKTLRQKLLECGAREVDFLPLGAFDFEMDPAQDQESILRRPRDIDLVYIGNPFFAQKLEGFLKLIGAFGDRLQIYGFWKLKHSAYLSLHARRRVWVRSVSLAERVRLYQRAKIGFNMHWDAWGLGNQRLYHLPANGVMQICDSPGELGEIFEKGREVIPAATFDEMVDRGRYYLAHDEERRAVALAGFQRVSRDYRIRTIHQRLGAMLRRGMAAQGFPVG
jgi:spore maturation protein CgeB